MKIYELKKTPSNYRYISEIVDLHMRVFPNFFLTKLGKNFLLLLYKGYLEDDTSGVIVAEIEQKVVGFIAYSNNYSQFYSNLIRNHVFAFALASLGAALKHPAFIKRLFGAFQKSEEVKREDAYVELASIGVSRDYNNKGIGHALIDYLKQITDFEKYSYINLETDAVDNAKVNKFYLNNGFIWERSYTTREGRKMNEYHFFPSKTGE